MTTDDVMIFARIKSDLRDWLKRRAAKDNRTMSGYIRHILTETKNKEEAVDNHPENP